MEDLSRLTLRALLTLARERFGSAAASLKTRAELIAALSEPKAPVPSATAPAAPPVEVVTRDFFRRRS